MNSQQALALQERNAALEKELAVKTRELEIESSLESVRTVAMCMKQPADMLDVCRVISAQLELLEIKNIRNIQTAIFYENKGVYLNYEYFSLYDKTVITEVEYDLQPDIKAFVNKMQQEPEAFYTTSFEGVTLKEWMDYQTKANQFVDPKLSEAKALYYYFYSIGPGALGISTYAPLSEAHTAVFKRFRNVFDLAYRRFMDIQQAEAQSREAQIELALERVRARTMAMQRSEELADVAKLLFKQVKELGITAWTTGFNIWSEDNSSYIDWITDPSGEFLEPYTIEVSSHPVFEVIRNARESGTDFFVSVLEGQEIIETYELLNSFGNKGQFQKILASGISFPTHQVNHFVFGAQVSLLFITYEPCPEAWDIFKRFGKVFEQTYTRFLDLQKAEAQAKESQIEAALERIRSRSMAMQKSEELKEVIQVVYEQFVHLNILIEHTGFIIDYKANDDMHIWLADQQDIPTQVTIPYFDCAHWNSFNEAKEKGIDFFSNHVDFEEKNRFYQYLFKLVPGVPEEAKEYYLNCPGVAISTVLLENVGLYIENFSAIPYTDEENNTLMRFGKVFQQTYTRFLDLQRAEAQVREAQIETALEKIRSRSLGMHHSVELKDVVAILFEKLKDLNLVFDGGAAIHLFNEASKNAVIWVASPDLPEPSCVNLPYDENAFENNPIIMDVWDAKETGKHIYNKFYSFEEKDRYFHYVFKHNDFRTIPEPVREFILHADSYTASFIAEKNSLLGANSWSRQIFSDSDFELLKRIARVFEQAYLRFLDLQKAEAQAREAQIEAALERVRSRSMAMHKSDELHEVIKVVTEQLSVLGLKFNVANFAEIDPDGSWNMWLSTPEQTYPALIHVPYLDHPIFNDVTEQVTKKNDFYTHVYTLEESNIFFHHFFENTIAKNSPEERKQFVYSSKGFTRSLFLTKNIWFSVGRYDATPFTDEENVIFKRFAKVFEQTYTRFLDLQKAEAQARESQIQLAMERVRARTMAMQRSEELNEVAGLLFKQVNELGIQAWTTGFNVWSDDNNFYTDYVTSPQGNLIKAYTIDATKFSVFTDVSNAKKSGDEFWVQYLEGDLLKETYKQLSDFGDEKQFEKMLEDGSQFPSHQYDHFVFGSKVSLMFITYEPVPEAHDIFKRFGKTFEQTYTRFLDLQKAEAQALEARIEAALEKVRSRSLAMHKSDELQDVVHTVFEKLNELDVELYTAIIFIFAEDSKDVVWWLANRANQQYARILVPYADNRYLEDIFEAKEKGKDFFSATYLFEEKNELFHHLFENTDFKYVPEQQKQFLLESELATMSVALSKNTGINITSYTKKTFSEQENEILKRFAKVFDQAYTRFLDLQKAEAQAKEAKIEAALERVRARAMAMNNSDELGELVAILFEELVKLHLVLARCIIWIFDHDTLGARLWMANSEDKKTAESYYIKRLDHPYYEAIIKGWKEQNPKWVYDLRGSEKRAIDELLLNETELSHLPKKVKAGLLSYEHTIVSGSFNNFGLIEASGPDAHSEEQLEILSRFGKVFDLTYTRFNDLKQAEAQAREAIKRASVDRVRAEIASMRTTSDLEKITPLIWNELTTLGVPFIRCGVFIMDEEQQQVQSFLSTPDGKAIAAFRQPYNTPGEIAQIVANWRKKEVYKQHWDEAQFIKFTTNLLQQGAITSGEKYLTENRPTNLHLHFLPFLQGMLYAGNTAPLGDDELHLVQNLADAFSTAYARYDDFNKLESAKEQIETTLVDLKQAQAQLIQSEKMASLGELTAGIAHEIKNPLNFINNFSDLNTELIDELKEELHAGNTEEAILIANDIKTNEEKINHHGKRADAIVKGMLQHSRSSSGAKEPTDINALADEYLRLAYHGFRSKEKSFNATLKTDYDQSIGNINIIPQDIGRVILNLINNAFYAVAEKNASTGSTGQAYEPTVSISTKLLNTPSGDGGIMISVADNGNGIPQKIIDKIFNPFFTTKPTGEGTGLGLSLSYDIVKAHGGELKVETKEGEGSEFVIQIPIV